MESLDPKKHVLPDLSTILAGEKRGSGTCHSMFPVDVEIIHDNRSKAWKMMLRVPYVREHDFGQERRIRQQLEVRDALQKYGVPVIPTYRLVGPVQDPRTNTFNQMACVLATDLSRDGKNKVYSPTNVSDFNYPFRPNNNKKLPAQEKRIENADELLEKAWACAKGASDAEYCLTNPDAFVFELDYKCNQAFVFIGDYKHFRNFAGTSQEQALLSNCRMSQWAVDSMGPFTGIPEDEVLNFFNRKLLVIERRLPSYQF